MHHVFLRATVVGWTLRVSCPQSQLFFTLVVMDRPPEGSIPTAPDVVAKPFSEVRCKPILFVTSGRQPLL